MTPLDREGCVSRSLRRLLADLSIGAKLYDLERPQPEQTGNFFPCLEYFLPAVLAEIHLEWRDKSFDGFLPIFAIKVAEREAELFGPCVIISDASWAAFHLKIRISPIGDEVSWLELSVGEKGYFSIVKGRRGAVKTLSFSSIHNRLYLRQEHPEEIDWVYKVTFGDREL